MLTQEYLKIMRLWELEQTISVVQLKHLIYHIRQKLLKRKDNIYMISQFPSSHVIPQHPHAVRTSWINGLLTFPYPKFEHSPGFTSLPFGSASSDFSQCLLQLSCLLPFGMYTLYLSSPELPQATVPWAVLLFQLTTLLGESHQGFKKLPTALSQRRYCLAWLSPTSCFAAPFLQLSMPYRGTACRLLFLQVVCFVILLPAVFFFFWRLRSQEKAFFLDVVVSI